MKTRIIITCAILFMCTTYGLSQYAGVYHRFSSDNHSFLWLYEDGSFRQAGGNNERSILNSEMKGNWERLNDGTVKATAKYFYDTYETKLKPIVKDGAVIGFTDMEKKEGDPSGLYEKLSSNPNYSIDFNNLKTDLNNLNKTQANAVDCEYARQQYLIQNPDVQKAGIDPWSHYNSYGKNEGRKWPDCNESKSSQQNISSNKSTSAKFVSETDVMYYLNGKTFVNDYSTKITFNDMATNFTMGGNMFYQPEVTVLSETKAIIKYYNATDPSSNAIFTVNALNNTITTKSSGTVWNIVE